jgi:hypothetical protein
MSMSSCCTYCVRRMALEVARVTLIVLTTVGSVSYPLTLLRLSNRCPSMELSLTHVTRQIWPVLKLRSSAPYVNVCDSGLAIFVNLKLRRDSLPTFSFLSHKTKIEVFE